MLDFQVLFKIRKNALNSIKTDSDGELIKGTRDRILFLILFTVLPVLSTSLPWLNHIKLSDLASFITTGIAIFTGLFFSLLLNISAKIRIEKENVNIDVANFQAFKENMRQISDITLYVIILGVGIMVLVLLNYLLNFGCAEVEYGFASAALFFLWRFFLCLFFMLQRFFYVLRDEIKNIL